MAPRLWSSLWSGIVSWGFMGLVLWRILRAFDMPSKSGCLLWLRIVLGDGSSGQPLDPTRGFSLLKVHSMQRSKARPGSWCSVFERTEHLLLRKPKLRPQHLSFPSNQEHQHTIYLKFWKVYYFRSDILQHNNRTLAGRLFLAYYMIHIFTC